MADNTKGILTLLVLGLFSSCHHSKSAINKHPSNRQIIFNGAYKNDRIEVFNKRKLVLDTIVSSSPFNGTALNYFFSYSSIKIKINNDTTFNIINEWSDYKVFLILKDEKYVFAKAKDTSIATY
jgi:hypothetical protein